MKTNICLPRFASACLFAITPLIMAIPCRGQVYEKVYGFSDDIANTGSQPRAGLLQGSDGNMYGTTAFGGSGNLGTAFKMTPSGEVTTLAEFTGASETAATPKIFGNSTPITIDAGSSGSPYPSRINVPPGIERISKIRVVLHDYSHQSPSTVRLLLVGPDGKTCLLISGTGGGNDIFNETLTLDDSALNQIPPDFQSGTYRPTGGSDHGNNMHPPAPPAPYGSELAVFNGQSATGIWSLYALDEGLSGSGSIKGGWTLEITPTGMKGSHPSGLVEGDDGNLYGTTSGGGSSARGTVFRITPGGVLATLADFPATATGGANSSLLPASDGNFYGTTSTGGSNGLGSVFRFTLGQPLETLVSFSGNGPSNKGGQPLGSLIEGSDGMIYGTTSVGGTNGFGTIYRFVPGQVIETLVHFSGNGANDQGSAPKAALVQGSDGKFYGTTSSGGIGGFGTIFRFTPQASLETLVNFTGNSASNKGGAPLAALTEIAGGKFYGTTSTGGTGGAGTVFRLTPGQPLETLVNFTTPDGAPFSPLTLAEDGLPYGTTSGPAGTIYRLIVPALPILSAREPLFVDSVDPLSVLFQIGIHPSGAGTELTLEYGRDGISFPNQILIGTGISGISTKTMGSTVTELLANTTYHYRFRATNIAGTTVGEVRSFRTSSPYFRSDQLGQSLRGGFPGAPPQAQGTVLVAVEPPGIGGWRFEGELTWRAPGVAASGLATSERIIQFRPVSGYLQPEAEKVIIISGTTAHVQKFYYPTAVPGNAGLTVNLKPDSIAPGSIPSANRAQWRILGENDNQWRDSGSTYPGLIPGEYLVEFKPVTGRVTPPPSPASLTPNAIAARTITYHPADSTAGTGPSPITFATATTDTTKPYAYVGQIRSGGGSGSGFVVTPRVALTAARVVFDDGTLSGLTDLQWLFQRDHGTYEPKPIIPRGSYILRGYAAQRAAENTPGDFARESENLDVGVIYFVDEQAGRGGFTAILSSNSPENEFLVSNGNKIIVGYPVNGISPVNQGRMHTTAPVDAVFTGVFERVYTTPDIRSGYGSAGGPLCVQRPDGFYYPVAVHLGGSTNTLVRAIDDIDVTQLIGWADTAASGGGNPPSGGPTQTGIDGAPVSSAAGALKVTIEPAAARVSGAGWQLTPETTFQLSGRQKGGLTPGSYGVNFKTVPGFLAPASQTVAITDGAITAMTYTYQPSLTPLDTWRFDNFGTTENTGDAADDNDFDNDGETNLEEFTAGTNPKDSNDFLKMATAAKSGNTFTTTCAGKAGRTYTLFRNTGLSGTWTRLDDPQGPLGNDGTVTLSDTDAPPDKSFYRIEVKFP